MMFTRVCSINEMKAFEDRSEDASRQISADQSCRAVRVIAPNSVYIYTLTDANITACIQMLAISIRLNFYLNYFENNLIIGFSLIFQNEIHNQKSN